jgi:hypothetical protein
MGLYVDSGSIYETQQNTGEHYNSSICSQHSKSAAAPSYCAPGSHASGCVGGASSCQLSCSTSIHASSRCQLKVKELTVFTIRLVAYRCNRYAGVPSVQGVKAQRHSADHEGGPKHAAGSVVYKPAVHLVMHMLH